MLRRHLRRFKTASRDSFVAPSLGPLTRHPPPFCLNFTRLCFTKQSSTGAVCVPGCSGSAQPVIGAGMQGGGGQMREAPRIAQLQQVDGAWPGGRGRPGEVAAETKGGQRWWQRRHGLRQAAGQPESAGSRSHWGHGTQRHTRPGSACGSGLGKAMKELLFF